LEQTHNGWWNFHFGELTYRNYVRAWHEGLASYVANSFVITVGAVALTLATGLLASYAFVRLTFRLKRFSYFLLITTMILPVQIILAPLLPGSRPLGLQAGRTQSLGILLVPTASGAGWAVFMLSSFIADIPDELFEAAQVDGASHFDLFRRVVLRLSLPGIV